MAGGYLTGRTTLTMGTSRMTRAGETFTDESPLVLFAHVCRASRPMSRTLSGSEGMLTEPNCCYMSRGKFLPFKNIKM